MKVDISKDVRLLITDGISVMRNTAERSLDLKLLHKACTHRAKVINFVQHWVLVFDESTVYHDAHTQAINHIIKMISQKW